MDWLTFLSKIIEETIWPALILFLLWKSPISLSQLPDIFESLKYGKAEVKFRQQLKQAQEDLEAVPQPKPKKAKPLSKTEDQKRRRIYELADIAPQAVILESWQDFMATMRDIVPDPEATMTMSASRLIDLAIEDGPRRRLSHALRKIRNEAVHARKKDIKPGEAIEFYNMTKSLIILTKIDKKK